MSSNTLKALADSLNTTDVDLIIEAVNRTGSINAAARDLGCANNAIRHHIKRNNLRTIRTQERSRLERAEVVS